MSQSKLFCHLSSWLIAAVMLLFSSCDNNKTDLLKVIPADTDVLVSFNAEKLLVSAGCKIDNNKIELSNTLESILKYAPAKIKDTLNDISALGCIDLQQAIFAVDHPNGAYLVFPVTNEKRFKEYVEGLDIEFDKEEEFDIAQIDKTTYLLLNDNIGWIYACNHKSDTEATTAKIKNILERAEKESVADISWKSEIFSPEHFASVMFNTKFSDSALANNVPKVKDLYEDEKYEDAEMAFVVDIEGTSITITTNIYDHNGEKMDIYPFDKKIDESFLKYVSADDLSVIAFAIDPQIPWRERLLSLVDKVDTNLKGKGDASSDDAIDVLEMITSILENADGTLSVAFCPTDGLSSFDHPSHHNWDFVATAQLKQGQAKEVLNLCSLILAQSDMSVTLNGPSSLSITIPDKTDKSKDITLVVEAIGDTIIVSNRQIEPKEKSTFDPSLFEDNVGVCIIDIPADYINSILEEFNKKIPFGIKFTGTASQTSTVLTLSLTETDGNFFDKLINWCYESFM